MSEILPNNALSTPFLYTKRPGTSGIGGQLYESKLLSLFLLRALNYKDITRFHLATNIEGIGAFDDIVLQYESKNQERPKVVFIQAKHKEDVKKNNITANDLFKKHEDFSLHKYFESYLKIRLKFNSNSNDDIFKYPLKDIECDLIVYTPAIENIEVKKNIIDENLASKCSLFRTAKTGQVFQLSFSNEEVERLLMIILEIRIQLLGKTLMKFLMKENTYQNLLMDDLIKTYHVFLAQQVVEVTSETDSKNPFLRGKFRSSFFESEDMHLIMLKETIYKEFASKYNSFSSEEIKNFAQSFSFQLPINFGNINFNIGGSSPKIERRLRHICSKLKKMIDSAESDESFIIKIDDFMVGPELILQRSDFEMYRIGGLVGSLFVLDDETFKLKFNKSVESLPPLVMRIFELLKNEYPKETDFNKYRFDINVSHFPKLLFGRDENDLKLVREFLDRLIFYTNQACENDVEKILKSEITKYYGLNSIRDRLHRRMRCESIFLKVHDTIQKWWKQLENAPYLDESCEYYDEAKLQLFSYSLLNTLHFLYTMKLSNYGVQFKQNKELVVNLDKHKKGVLNIVTNNITLTGIKLIQYLNRNNQIYSSYVFLNLDFIMSEECFDDVVMELGEIKPNIIFFTCENNEFFGDVVDILESLQIFVVMITKNEFREALYKLNPVNYVQIYDNRLAFSDLCEESQSKLLDEYKVIFQGFTVPLNELVNKNFKIIDFAALFSILNKEIIHIGRELTSAKFKNIEDCYIERSICRFITLKTNVSESVFIIQNADIQQVIPKDKREVIVISDKQEDYDRYCDIYKDVNIHWFVNDNERFIWQKSRGSLRVISENVDKNSCENHSYKPKSLLDIDEKVLILCAGPGMGKSTLMTHLSIRTTNTQYWILKINCLDYKNLFSSWQENNTVIGLKELINFLYIASLKYVNDANNIDVSVDPDGSISVDNSNDRKLVGLAYLEVQLFNNFYNNGKIVVIFDGVDEISPDYLDIVISLLRILRHSKVKCLWITTRPYNIVNTLEQQMGTFGFILEKLDSDEQVSLFGMLLSKTIDEKPNIPLKNYAISFLDSFRRIHRGLERGFTTVPIHIHMIAEIYSKIQNSYEQSSSQVMLLPVLDFLRMYEQFVNIKFYKIHFGEKKPYSSDKDPDMKEMLELARRRFIENHKKLAAHTLFKKTVRGLFSYQDEKDICNALERIRKGEERTGIIDKVIGDEPIFVHLTFAEYFASEYLCDKLKSEDCSEGVWIYLLDTIFIADEFCNLRTYFDLKLQADTQLNDAAQTLKYKQEIFDVLIKQPVENSLYRALVDVSLERNALFILKCIKDALTENNLSAFIYFIINAVNEFFRYEARRNRILYSNDSVGRWCTCKTILNNAFRFITYVNPERLQEVFVCGDFILFKTTGIFMSYVGLTSGDGELLDIMMTTVKDSDIILNLFTMAYNEVRYKKTIFHTLVNYRNSIRFLIKYLMRFNKEQRMKIFNTFDADGKLAVHLAAEISDLDFFSVLAFLLGADKFSQICMTSDKYGNAPIEYWFSNICQYVFNNKLRTWVRISIKRWCMNGILRLKLENKKDENYAFLTSKFDGYTSFPRVFNSKKYYIKYLYQLSLLVFKRYAASYRLGRYYSSMRKRFPRNRKKLSRVGR